MIALEGEALKPKPLADGRLGRRTSGTLGFRLLGSGSRGLGFRVSGLGLGNIGI